MTGKIVGARRCGPLDPRWAIAIWMMEGNGEAETLDVAAAGAVPVPDPGVDCGAGDAVTLLPPMGGWPVPDVVPEDGVTVVVPELPVLLPPTGVWLALAGAPDGVGGAALVVPSPQPAIASVPRARVETKTDRKNGAMVLPPDDISLSLSLHMT